MNDCKKMKVTITEEDVSLLLQRYSATTILALLQEISHSSGVKIDWNTLAKRTSTGISCPREYQMLWRHLAYHHSLVGKIENGAEPLDDDSDMDLELEAFPPVRGDASTEAAACVKVLMSSGLPNDSSTTNRSTVEAPLTINIPNGQASHDSSDNKQKKHSTCGLNITVPVSVQKQSLPPMMPVEGLDCNGPTTSKQASKKKRKLWTKEEDLALISAVHKCGEGNWQNILKEDFKHERTASQLSQRWSILKKNLSKPSAVSSGNPKKSTLSEAQLSARQAISMALNMPTIGSLSAICSGNVQSNTAAGLVPPGAPSEASSLPSQKVPLQAQQGISHKGLLPTSNKSRTIQTKPLCPVKPSTGPNPLIQKAAFAAGGRIANPSTVASLFKAAQSKNAVHIRPGIVLPISQAQVSKASTPGGTFAPRSSNIAQSRIVSPAHPGIQPTGSGPGSQQTACGSSKLSSQVPPSTTTLSGSSSSQLSGDSKSAIPVNDGVCGNIEDKSFVIAPVDVLTVSSKVETEVVEQVNVNSSVGQEGASDTIQMKNDGFLGEDQVTMAEDDHKNNVVEHVEKTTAAEHLLTSIAASLEEDQGVFENIDDAENSNSNLVANDVADGSHEA